MKVLVETEGPYHAELHENQIRFGGLTVEYEAGNRFFLWNRREGEKTEVDEFDVEDTIRFMLKHFEPCFPRSAISVQDASSKGTPNDPSGMDLGLAIHGAENAQKHLDEGRIDLARKVLNALLVLLDHLHDGKRKPTFSEAVYLLPPGCKLVSIKSPDKTYYPES